VGWKEWEGGSARGEGEWVGGGEGEWVGGGEGEEREGEKRRREESGGRQGEEMEEGRGEEHIHNLGIYKLYACQCMDIASTKVVRTGQAAISAATLKFTVL